MGLTASVFAILSNIAIVAIGSMDAFIHSRGHCSDSEVKKIALWAAVGGIIGGVIMLAASALLWEIPGLNEVLGIVSMLALALFGVLNLIIAIKGKCEGTSKIMAWSSGAGGIALGILFTIFSIRW